MPALSHALIGAAAVAVSLTAALPAFAQTKGAADAEAQADTAPLTKGEKRLAKLLEGRVAGEPMRCIRTLPSQRMQTIDGTAYVYGSGNKIYVQRTRDPDQINDRDALVTRRFGSSELCRLDLATTIDRFNGFFTGAVFFEDFVPYSRVKDEAGGEG
jgi:hypothetical protein